MRADFTGGLRFLWLAAAGAMACTDPSAAPLEVDGPAEPVPLPSRVPAGFLELWPGGPVLPDQPRIRSTLAAQARTHATGMRGASRMAYSVVQTSTADSLDGGAAEGSQAMDVNRAGTVVGTVMDALPGGTPVTWSSGGVTPVPLPKREEWEDPLPAAINDAGDIVGHAQILLGNGTYRSRVVRWGSNGSLTTLPPLAGLEDAWYEAVDIAPNGDILGQIDVATPYPPLPYPNQFQVILWQGGIASEVGPSGEGAVPIAVNSNGTILATLSSGPAVRSPTGTWTPLASPPGDLATFATDLGEDGTVVGGALDHATSTYFIVRWAPDGTPAVIPPPTFGQHGFASAINYTGRILLTVFEPGASVPGAYLLDGTDYSPLPAITPATASALTLTGLSDANVAIGYWQLTYVRQAVRWTIELANPATSNRALGFMQDYVRVADHADLDLRNTWTLEAWVYPRAAGKGADEDLIAKWGGVTDAAYILQLDGATGKLRLVTNNGVSQSIILSKTPLTNGVWQHVAATFSNGVVKLYINGVQVRRMTGARTPINSSQPLAFGREGNFSGGTFDGRLDEIRIWKVVRTANQIANWRGRTLNGTENGLVGYWRFDEGQGQVAGDATGRGHNGRLGETTGADDWDPRWTNVGAPLR